MALVVATAGIMLSVATTGPEIPALLLQL
jgi:hypothetical protein